MSFSLRPILLTLTMVGTVIGVRAQNVKLNFFGGYTFQDKFNTSGGYYGYDYSNARIGEAPHFGGSIEFELRPNKCLELLYQNQATQGYINGSYIEFGPYDISINYLMIGGVGYKPFNEVVSGYGGLNVGCGFMTGDANATKFAWGGKLGLQVNASPKVGIKLGCQLFSAVQGFGGGFYFGTGGASAGVTTYSSIYQFGFTGGLVFTLDRGGSGSMGTRPPPPPPPPAYPR